MYIVQNSSCVQFSSEKVVDDNFLTTKNLWSTVLAIYVNLHIFIYAEIIITKNLFSNKLVDSLYTNCWNKTGNIEHERSNWYAILLGKNSVILQQFNHKEGPIVMPRLAQGWIQDIWKGGSIGYVCAKRAQNFGHTPKLLDHTPN